MNEPHSSPRPDHRTLSAHPLPELAPGSSGPGGAADGAGLLEICHEIADRFVLACLVNDHPFAVREAMEIGLAEEYDLPSERAERLFDLALEVMHLRIHGRYFSPLAEIGHLIAAVTGGLAEPGSN
jgi:hypothetical protein